MKQRTGRLDRLAFAAQGLLDLLLGGLFLWLAWIVFEQFFLEQWAAGRVSLTGTLKALDLHLAGNTAYLLPLAYLVVAGIWSWLGFRLLRIAQRPWTLSNAQRGWWMTKQSLELTLIGWAVFYRVLHPETGPALQLPDSLTRPVALLGGAVAIWHYVLIRTAGKDALVQKAGLFRYLRHPMYLGELILSAALALMAGDPVAIALFALIAGCLLVLLPAEDAELRERHASAWPAWAQGTGALLPRRRRGSA